MNRVGKLILVAAASLGLAGCSAYDGYGYGGWRGHASVGYYDGWYDPYYRYGGWYDGYFWPGYGYYIFDRRGKRHHWNHHHRRHWEARRDRWRDHNRDGGRWWREGRRTMGESGDARREWRREHRGDSRRSWRGSGGDSGRAWRSESRGSRSSGSGRQSGSSRWQRGQ